MSHLVLEPCKAEFFDSETRFLLRKKFFSTPTPIPTPKKNKLLTPIPTPIPKKKFDSDSEKLRKTPKLYFSSLTALNIVSVSDYTDMNMIFLLGNTLS
jgi:hypothetical protein